MGKTRSCCWCKKKRHHDLPKSPYDQKTTGEVFNALAELVSTEKSYGKDLNCMAYRYLEALEKEVLFFDNTDLIAFHCVTLDLVYIQRKFQLKLETATENLNGKKPDLSNIVFDVAKTFIEYEEDFIDMYSRYILCMSRVQKVISKSSGNEKVVTFFERKFNEFSAQAVTASGNKEKETTMSKRTIQPIEALLMRPMQRVMLYPLILERIQKQSQERTRDRQMIGEAIESIKNVGAQMNNTLARAEKSDVEFRKILKEYNISEYKK